MVDVSEVVDSLELSEVEDEDPSVDDDSVDVCDSVVVSEEPPVLVSDASVDELPSVLELDAGCSVDDDASVDDDESVDDDASVDDDESVDDDASVDDDESVEDDESELSGPDEVEYSVLLSQLLDEMRLSVKPLPSPDPSSVERKTNQIPNSFNFIRSK